MNCPWHEKYKCDVWKNRSFNVIYLKYFRTPLHCAASCNNTTMVRFLVEHGACIFATTLSDHETAAEKCEEDEEGFDGCSEYLYSMFFIIQRNIYYTGQEI